MLNDTVTLTATLITRDDPTPRSVQVTLPAGVAKRLGKTR